MYLQNFFQKHVVATLVGLAVPVFFPPCYVYREVGIVIVGGEHTENLLGVSADGILECKNGYKDCEFNCSQKFGLNPIPVEIKCPFNKDNPYYDKFYTMPEMYVPQVTNGWNVDHCLTLELNVLLNNRFCNLYFLVPMRNHRHYSEIKLPTPA